MANPVDVGTSTQVNGWAINYGTFQNKVFMALGLRWIFYCDGTNNAVVRTSNDNGATWSASANLGVSGEGYGHAFGLAIQGTKIAFCAETATPGGIVYRLGTISVAAGVGVVTWDAAEQTAVTGGATLQGYSPGIYFDSAGYNYIAYTNNDADDPSSNVVRSSTKDGTWTTDAAFTKKLVAANGSSVCQLAMMTGGKVYAIYSKPVLDVSYLCNYLYGNLWNGSAWVGETQITTTKCAYSQFSVSNIGDSIVIAFMHWTSAAPDFYYYWNAFNGTTWSNAVQFDTADNQLRYFKLVNNGSSKYFLYWVGSPTQKHVYYRILSSGAWGAVVDWYTDANVIYGSAPDGQASGVWHGNIDCAYNTYNLIMTYLTGTASPFTIRSGSATVPKAGRGWCSK